MTYFSPLTTLVVKTFMYKKGVLIPLSAGVSVTLEMIGHYLLNTSFLGVTSGFLVIISFLFLIDFWTGSSASHHEYKNALKKEEAGEILEKGSKSIDKKFNSSKITFTFFKFIMLFLWIWLAFVIGNKIKDVDYLSHLYNVIAKIPLILVALREYVSIGENLKREYGKMPYIFTLAEKLFDFLQGKFFEKIKNNNSQETTDNKNKEYDDY